MQLVPSDILEGSVTSALCDALFRVTNRTTDKASCKIVRFNSCRWSDLSSFTLDAAAKASLIAWIVTVVRCVARRNVSCNLSDHFREKLRMNCVTDRWDHAQRGMMGNQGKIAKPKQSCKMYVFLHISVLEFHFREETITVSREAFSLFTSVQSSPLS